MGSREGGPMIEEDHRSCVLLPEEVPQRYYEFGSRLWRRLRQHKLMDLKETRHLYEASHASTTSRHRLDQERQTSSSRLETRLAHCVGRASVCIYGICLSRWISTCSSFWLTLLPPTPLHLPAKKIKRGIVKQCTPVNPAFPQPIN